MDMHTQRGQLPCVSYWRSSLTTGSSLAPISQVPVWAVWSHPSAANKCANSVSLTGTERGRLHLPAHALTLGVSIATAASPLAWWPHNDVFIYSSPKHMFNTRRRSHTWPAGTLGGTGGSSNCDLAPKQRTSQPCKHFPWAITVNNENPLFQ